MPFHLPSAVLNHDRIFYSWDHSIFQYQTMCKSSVEPGLVYKTFINKHTCETPLLPRKKTNCIHCSCNAVFFGKLNKVIFPSQPKAHFFRDILPERVLCSTIITNCRTMTSQQSEDSGPGQQSEAGSGRSQFGRWREDGGVNVMAGDVVKKL